MLSITLCKKKRIFITVLLLQVVCLPAYSQKQIWDRLSKGKYAVGFYSTVAFDYAQNYPYCIDSSRKIKKYPKPLIINIWYPAITGGDSKKMSFKSYAEFQSIDKNIRGWLQQYRDYTENTQVEQLLGKKKIQLDSLERIFWQNFLNRKSMAEKNAKHASGKFPVVIYHQGAGASFEDNSILCELLATYGYVVIGCSFQSADGENLASHGKEESVKDAGFLLSFAHDLPFADWSQTAIIGHSLGGQAVNYMAAQGNMAFDAMVSLETTQEYYIGSHDMWPFANYVDENAYKAKTSFLLASNPYAIHDLADKMINAERYYLTIPDLGHNDFISQGIQKKYVLSERNKNMQDAKNNFELALSKYSILCDYIISFLNAHLKEDKESMKNLLSNNSLKLGYTQFLEQMPREKSRDDYPENSQLPPSPRQLKFLIQARKIDEAVGLIGRFWKSGSKDPIYDPTLIYALTDHLLKKDTSNAKKLYNAYKNILDRSIINKQFLYFIQLYSRFGLKEYVRMALDKLVMLDPENAEEIKGKHLK